ncbi:Heterokaryon incompatibility protein [Hyphodiscus hymeniophilus]|uniref:Heterokaryon incompatibility protein n=1 Tax=Hyphodiscus hymeniophilus TaxID=353542 RepID=A0A9P6VDG0_9HELO|nr:Heterokaryon incompatibility protein [Hyphodiscus hymeniophilus]
MDFAYDSTLVSNELRLLQPVAVNNQFLRFKTRRVKRESRTPYTAVSYTWGNEDASEVIYLDNRRFYVRPNLWSCLFYIAQAARNAAWDYLWVDAICIDQTNGAERNSQVRLMDQTYRDAVCVSVWLGLATLPEDILRHLSTQMPIKRVESDGFDWFDSIVDLSNRPYWSRVWVIQEFLIGRDVNLYCSDSQVNWTYFQDLICRETGINQFYDARHDSPLRDRRSARAALPLVMGRHMDKHPEILQPLCDLLIDHHKSECKDPRDRVFALLGLITTHERGFLSIYFPDYTLTEDHVRIITLAHLTQFPEESRMARNGENITPDSEELFLGLGVGPKSERKRLLRRARKIDYLSGNSPAQILNILTSHDQMEEYEGEDWEEQEEVYGTEPRRSLTKTWLIMFVIVITTLAVGWWIAKTNYLKAALRAVGT